MAESQATLTNQSERRGADRGATRVAVLVEGGRRGNAAVIHALALAACQPLEATLVAVIAHADNSGCTMSAGPLNDAVRESAEADLARAGGELAASVMSIRSLVLREHRDPPLSSWAAGNEIDLILLPGRVRPLRHGLRHPQQRALAEGDATVRIV